MALRYQTGEEVLKGDRVLLHGDSGVIEFVVDPDNTNPDLDWYVQEYGGGVMISQLNHLGSVFVSKPESDGCLDFVERASFNSPPSTSGET